MAAGEGAAGAAIRFLATLLLPAILLSFTHLYFWPVSVTASIVAGLVQIRPGASDLEAGLRRLAHQRILIIPALLVFTLLSSRAALSVASPPYDFDSALYHLPMAIEFLQAHTAVPAQMMFHPGNAELLDSIGLGTLGAVGGQTLTEAIVAVVLFLVAYGLAREALATRSVSLLVACSAIAVPWVGLYLFTAQNDILVAALLLGFVALWPRSPLLSAIAVGLAAGTKFTGLLEATVMVPILWRWRSPNLSWKHALVAALVAVPWYLRNAIQTGNPFFLGEQTAGYSSTIAGNGLAAIALAFDAIRNSGGLLAVVGIVAVFFLLRPTQTRSISSVFLWLFAAATVAWFATPNSAETQAHTLNQIAHGPSVRYALFSLILLNIAAVLWLSRANFYLAFAVTIVSLAFTAVRNFNQLHQIDSGVMFYVVPLMAAAVAGTWCLLGGRRALAMGASACAVFAIVSVFGAMRISMMWSRAYEAAFGFRYGPLLASQALERADRIATISIPALPLMGPHFERYAVANANGLTASAWWTAIALERPQVVVAANVLPGNAMNSYERLLRSIGHFETLLRYVHVRMYAPVSH